MPAGPPGGLQCVAPPIAASSVLAAERKGTARSTMRVAASRRPASRRLIASWKSAEASSSRAQAEPRLRVTGAARALGTADVRERLAAVAEELVGDEHRVDGGAVVKRAPGVREVRACPPRS